MDKAFGAVAEAYSQYRPTYPPSLFTAILDHNPHLGRGQRRDVAVDLACGSGQASFALAELFSRVFALDSSPGQIAAAKAQQVAKQANTQQKGAGGGRVEFREGDAHATGLESASADLVAMAQALHWCDVPLFAKEAARLLRAHGTLACWTYALASVTAVAGGGGGGGGGRAATTDAAEQRPLSPPPPTGHEAADAALKRVYSSLRSFFDDRRSHADDGYSRLLPQLRSSGAFERVESQIMEMRAWRTVDEVVGYVSSWSGTAAWREAWREAKKSKEKRKEEDDEDDEDHVALFRRELVAALGGDESGSVEMTTPIVLVLASGPRPQATAAD